MRKVLPVLIILTLFSLNAYGLPSLRSGEEPWVQPEQAAAPAAQREGVFREYYADGGLRRETTFKDGQAEGVCRTYYRSGGVHKQVYYEGGVLNGNALELYENGQYKLECEYIDGKANGQSKVYYENGDLYRLMVYNKGQLVKSFTLDPDGRSVGK